MPPRRKRSTAEQEDADTSDRKYFTPAQTRCLIDLHLKELRQDFLKCGSKVTYWDKVKSAMLEKFPDLDQTWQQLREKWRNLDKDYRTKKKEAGKTGAGKTTWPYFSQIDAEMGDRDDITLDGMTNIGGADNAMALDDFGAREDELDDPAAIWSIDRAESAEKEGSTKARGKKKMKTGKDEVLARVDQMLASTDEAMKTLTKLADNQEKLVEQNEKSVTASQDIADSQRRIADSFASIANLFMNR